jgi:hypothetical protein
LNERGSSAVAMRVTFRTKQFGIIQNKRSVPKKCMRETFETVSGKKPLWTLRVCSSEPMTIE